MLRAMDLDAFQDLRLSDASGAEHRLGDYFAEHRVVLVFLRHFG